MDSEDEMDIAIATCIVVISTLLWIRTTSTQRQWGVRPIYRKRRSQGEYWNLFCEMKRGDPEQFFKYCRMDSTKFDELLDIVKPYLRKRKMRTTLIPEERLALTLRYLATGDQIHSIAWGFRVGRSTARQVIIETCDALWTALSPTHLPRKRQEDWTQISNDFWERWNFPNCVGAIDGKHIAIQAPPNSGSLYFSYKKIHSIVLMAVCDAHYKFSIVDVGAYGSDNDAGIFSKSDFGKALLRNELDFPPETRLPNSNRVFPHFVVGDEAFPLHTSIMRPYAGKLLSEQKSIFNYRLSRARRIIENTFGIYASRWRVFRKSFLAFPETVDKVVLACVCLHNFLMQHEAALPAAQRRYCPESFVDSEDLETGEVQPGAWRQDGRAFEEPQVPRGGNRTARQYLALRDTLAEYCTSREGAVPWQNEHVNRGRVGFV